MTDRYAPLVERLRPLTYIKFRPASLSDLALLGPFGLPEGVLAFYRQYEPDRRGDLDCAPFPIREIVAQNRDFYPGAEVSRFGYVVFATDMSGDGLCFDLAGSPDPADPRVVRVEATPGYESAADVARDTEIVAENLADYLDKLGRGAIRLG